MTTSVEEFIIQLGFDDSEALKGYKDFLGNLDKLNKKVVQSINSTKASLSAARLEQHKADLTTNKILAQQLELRNKIIQGKQLGLDTSKEEATLSRAKTYETIRQRTLALEERISKELLQQAKQLQKGIKAPNIKMSVSFSPEQVERELVKIKKLLKLDAELGVDDDTLRSVISKSLSTFKSSVAKFELPVKQIKTLVDFDRGEFNKLSLPDKKVKLLTELDKEQFNKINLPDKKVKAIVYVDRDKLDKLTFPNKKLNVFLDVDKAELEALKLPRKVVKAFLDLDDSALDKLDSYSKKIKAFVEIDKDSLDKIKLPTKKLGVVVDKEQLNSLKLPSKKLEVLLDVNKEELNSLNLPSKKLEVLLDVNKEELNSLKLNPKKLDILLDVNKEELNSLKLPPKKLNLTPDVDFDKLNIPSKVIKTLIEVDKSKLDKLLSRQHTIKTVLSLPSYSSVRKDIKSLIDKLPNSNVNLGVDIAKGKRTELHKELKSLVERLSKYKVELGVSLDNSSYKELKQKLKDLDMKTDILSVDNDLKDLEVLRLKLEGLRDLAKKPVKLLETTSPKSNTNPKLEKDLAAQSLRTTLRNSITQAIKLDIDVKGYEKKVESLYDLDTIKKYNVEVRDLISQQRRLNAEKAAYKVITQDTPDVVKQENPLDRKKYKSELRDTIRQAVSLDLDVSDYQKKLDKLVDSTEIKKATAEVKELISQIKYLDTVSKKQIDVNLEDPMWNDRVKSAHKAKQEENKKLQEQIAYEESLVQKSLQRLDKESDRKKKEYEEHKKRVKEETQDIIKGAEKVRKAKQEEMKAVADYEEKLQKEADKRADAYQDKLEKFYNSAKFRKLQRVDPEGANRLVDQGNRFVQSARVKMSPDEVRKMDSSYNQFNGTLREAVDNLGRTQRAMIGLQTVQYGLRDSTRNMIRSYASLYAVFAGVSSINRVGQDFEAMNSAMLAATGTQEGVQEQMQFLDELTGRLGLSMRDTSDAFTKFLFAANGKLSTDQTQELFTSLTEMGTVLGISKERMKLSMNAISQINLSLLPQ